MEGRDEGRVGQGSADVGQLMFFGETLFSFDKFAIPV